MAGRYTPVYPIGVVRELTGLSERQIRYYDKMGVVVPRRTAGSKRLYSEEDVELLREVKALLARGMSIEEVKRELARRREKELARIREIEEFSDAKARFKDAPKTQVERRTEASPGMSAVKGPQEARDAGEPRRLLRSIYPVRNHGELNKLIDKRQG